MQKNNCDCGLPRFDAKDLAALPGPEFFNFGAFTICRVKQYVETQKGTKIFQGVGISKQSPRDARNEEMGNKVALGRALKALHTKAAGKEIRHQYMS